MDVVDAPALSDADKQKALETWETEERALQRASEEGMTGGTPPRLADVKHAKRELDVPDDEDGKKLKNTPGASNDKL